MDVSALHIAVSTEESLEVLRPVSEDEVLSEIRLFPLDCAKECDPDKWAHTQPLEPCKGLYCL